jgi:hypothetical protein
MLQSNPTESSNDYVQHPFSLPPNQIKMIVEAINSKTTISFKLTKTTFKDGNMASLSNATKLPLTKSEAQKVKDEKTFTYNFNLSKIKLMKLEEKDGGFIPVLLAGLAGIAGLISAGSTIAKTVIDKNANDSKQAEDKRHNLEMEKIASSGEGLYLNPPQNQEWKGYGIKLNVKEFINHHPKYSKTGKKTLRNIIKNLSDNFKIERIHSKKRGDGLFLSYK